VRSLAPDWLPGSRLPPCRFQPAFHKHAGHAALFPRPIDQEEAATGGAKPAFSAPGNVINSVTNSAPNPSKGSP